ncbi:hypothetical protein [Salinicola halophilus]|uniref:hypothetical protein n=1 Tax=Salinicola halophilus TaxID=184065 RepID=UPI0013A64692|nr:hypothetical protein [Salinicola halophilus]
MKRVLDCLKVVFVSGEFLFFLLAFWWYGENREFFLNLWGAVSGKKESGYFFTVLPIAILISSYALGKRVLYPSNDNENKILCGWEYYWALEFRVYWSVLLCLVACVTSFCIFIDFIPMSNAIKGFLFLCYLAVPLVVITTLFLAELTIRKILATQL